jgi:hypothetical protein
MKLTYTLFVSVLLSVAVYGQDTTALKQQATMLGKALINGNYNLILDHTYPNVFAGLGSKESMLKVIRQGMDRLKAQGMVFESVDIGSPGKFYKSGVEIQCLLPENMTMKVNNGRLIAHSYLLAITRDHGRKWYFLDLNENTLRNLHKVVPNLNQNIVIPDPVKPTFYSN